MWLPYKLAKPNHDLRAPAASNKGRLYSATRDHESHAWLGICHVRHFEIMTQHDANLNAKNDVNSNGKLFAFNCNSTLVSNTLSLRPSLNVSDELSHPFKNQANL